MAGGLDLRDVTVLIVEDHKDSREAMAAMVSAYGARVQAAEDGAEAFLIALTDRPDLVLCDLEMPILDGYDLLRRLRRHDALRTVPVIAVSGYGSDADVKRTWEAGFSGHLVSP